MIKRTSAIILMAVFLSTGCSSAMDIAFPEVYGDNDSLDKTISDEINEMVNDIIMDTTGQVLSEIMDANKDILKKEVSDAVKEAMKDIDWDEVVEDGKYQEIIIKSPDGKELKRINTKKEIVEFVKNEKLENQTYFAGPLPTDAEKLLIFEYWQEPTETVFGENNKKLELVVIRALYVSDGVYYWVLEIPRYFTNANIMPEDAAHYFIDLVQ